MVRECQMAQHGALLAVMALLALKYIIEDTECLLDMRPFVQHDAFGALAHGCVSDLGARRNSILGKSFQNLSGPDHRYMGGLADP